MQTSNRINTSNLAGGAAAGSVAAMVMGVFAMFAGLTYLGSGLLTPLYHIASSIISPKAMMTSMQQAQAGKGVWLSAGPALLGLMIHVAIGAVFGVVFVFLAGRIRSSRGVLVAAGAAYGVLVMLFMSFIGLPIVAGVLGGGRPISDMAKMVGWTTFTAEHLLYGVVLGLLTPAWARAGAAPGHAGVAAAG